MVASFLRAEPGAPKWESLVAYIVGNYAAESCQRNFVLLHYENVFFVCKIAEIHWGTLVASCWTVETSAGTLA